MKFSYFFLSICFLSFILIYSCSTEEEESVAPVVQTPQPEPVEYTLTVSAADGGTVSTEGGTYDEGTEITITATPSEGYRFTGWEGNNSTSESLTITINSDQTLQAQFELIPIYTLTITTSKGGTVSSEGGTYDEGTEVTITATPNDGYRFARWEGNDSTNESITISINSNETIQAIFEVDSQNPWLVSVVSLDETNLEFVENELGFRFYFYFNDNLSPSFQETIKDIYKYLTPMIPVIPTESPYPTDGKRGMYVFAWKKTNFLPFEEIIPGGGSSISGIDGDLLWTQLEIWNDDFDSTDYTMVVHEFYHMFQNTTSGRDFPYRDDSRLIWLWEGAAEIVASLYAQQHKNYNWLLSGRRDRVTDLPINSPELLETYEFTIANYANSVFLVSVLLKEIQKKNNISEIEAYKKVLVEFFQSQRKGITSEILFQEVFDFSLESFYEYVKSYSPDIETVLPSGNITMEEIFEDL